jgi:DNA polymerase-3 subunit gamma/tau
MRIYQYADIIGNKGNVALLRKGIINGKVKNFNIFAGIMGTGKSSCAEITGLALTCHNTREGEPCLKCESCVTNLKALSPGGSGQSPNLVKKNLPSLKDKKDMQEMLDEIFVLSGSEGNNVYILEEAHAVPAYLQSSFMERIDRLGENTYIIMTTTQVFQLLPEIRNRTIPFTFSRITPGESKLLMDNTLKKFGMRNNPEVETLVLRYAQGIPRSIVLAIELIRDSETTEEVLAKRLGVIPNSVFIHLFESMQTGVRETYTIINSLLAGNSVDVLIHQLKTFVVNFLFALQLGESDEFTKNELLSVKTGFNLDVIYKIASIIERVNSYGQSDADFRLLMIKITNIMSGKSQVSALTENSREAAAQKVSADQTYREEDKIRKEQPTAMRPASLQSLAKFEKRD